MACLERLALGRNEASPCLINSEDSCLKNFSIVNNFYTCSKTFFALVNEETFLRTSQAYLIL